MSVRIESDKNLNEGTKLCQITIEYHHTASVSIQMKYFPCYSYEKLSAL